MTSRKKQGPASRAEYDDDILRNNVRADNRLNRELKTVERAQKVTFRDITFETQRLRKKIQNVPSNKSDSVQKMLLEKSREQTLSALARTSNIFQNNILNTNGVSDEIKSTFKTSTQGFDSYERNNTDGKRMAESQGMSNTFPGTSQEVESETLYDSFEIEKRSGEGKAEKRNIWDTLSVPKYSNNAISVRQRLQSEFQRNGSASISPRHTLSQIPSVHGQGIKRNDSHQTVKL
ncbi:uncharacterized protein LOC115215828 [Argonauta hians]